MSWEDGAAGSPAYRHPQRSPSYPTVAPARPPGGGERNLVATPPPRLRVSPAPPPPPLSVTPPHCSEVTCPWTAVRVAYMQTHTHTHTNCPLPTAHCPSLCRRQRIEGFPLPTSPYRAAAWHRPQGLRLSLDLRYQGPPICTFLCIPVVTALPSSKSAFNTHTHTHTHTR